MVGTCHGTIIGTDYLSPAKQWLEAALLGHGGYATLIVLSDGVKGRVETATRCPVVVVPNGVPAALLADRHGAYGTARFVAVGRLERQKGFDVLLEAFADVVEERPGLQLRIVGEGSQRSELEMLAARLGVTARVNIGPLAPADVAAAYRGSDALVLSSRWEGMPLTLLEAWASGCAVVATAVGSIPDVVDDSDAVLVAPEDAKALAAAMSRLAANPSTCQSLGDAGRAKVAARYTWDHVAERYEQIYRRVIS